MAYNCSNYVDDKKINGKLNENNTMRNTSRFSLFSGDQNHPLYPIFHGESDLDFCCRRPMSCVEASWKHKKLDRKCKAMRRPKGINIAGRIWQEFFWGWICRSHNLFFLFCNIFWRWCCFLFWGPQKIEMIWWINCFFDVEGGNIEQIWSKFCEVRALSSLATGISIV